jgi:hypothetical protein
VMCDMPHVVKKVVNSMERRGEDMMLDGKPVSLKMLRDVWTATHFHECNNRYCEGCATSSQR